MVCLFSISFLTSVLFQFLKFMRVLYLFSCGSGHLGKKITFSLTILRNRIVPPFESQPKRYHFQMEMEIKKIFKKVSKNMLQSNDGHIYPKMYFFHLLKVSHLGFETTFLHARLVYWLKWISSFQFIMRLRLFYFKVINLLQRFLHEMALFFKIRSSHFFFFSCNTKRKKKLEKALRTKVIF